ncbi:hypothetical protein [Actinomadura rayongensis]|uniref:Uncharacterized protein n=1 Tax=Actinomadura rayongensis TaxID=1429076 RepID=A0A6I4VX94_9ACTN|nr:hypothetical protein [Actinomadura rayongensis]MXQ62557.1 hypothetical protein [Actinomadura rayongensis]
MTEIVDYGAFAGRLRAVMPRWDERPFMPPEVFAAHLADTAPRWDLLRAFQEEWGFTAPSGPPAWRREDTDEHRLYVRKLHGDVLDADDEEDMEGVDVTLPIPKAVDEWWDLPFNSFTHEARLYWTHPVWPPTVRPDPSGYGVSAGLPDDTDLTDPDGDLRVCVLMAEYQYCNEWGYAASDAALADPRLLVSDGSDEWWLQADSVTEFYVQLAAMRLPFALRPSVEVAELPPEAATRLRTTFPAMGFAGPWRELGAHTTLYGGPDVILAHDEGAADITLRAAGRTPEALLAAGTALGLDWTTEITPPRDRP